MKKLSDILHQLDSNKQISSALRSDQLPQMEDLARIILQLQRLLFPGHFGKMLKCRLDLLKAFKKNLTQEIRKSSYYQDEAIDSKEIVDFIIDSLPMLKSALLLDIEAAWRGDPAAKNLSEILISYPGIKVLTYHRFAHLLYQKKVFLIPRLLAEMAHSLTAIDIHPGATIGRALFIDHGTGVVIGETAIIGNNVTIYQGVTLGAKSFPRDAAGITIKDMARHPIIEDNVIIYAGATILGRITIGKNSIVGSNVWITSNIAPSTTVLPNKTLLLPIKKNKNI